MMHGQTKIKLTGQIINKIRWKPDSGNFLSSMVQDLGFLKVKTEIQNLVLQYIL